MRPSGSVAARVPVMALSSGPELDVSPEMVAGSSTALMDSAMAWVVVPPRSSVIVTVKESEPLKLVDGV